MTAADSRSTRSIEDFRRWTIERGLRHIGIGTSNHVADYYRQYKRDAAAILEDMVAAGTALPVAVDSWKEKALSSTVTTWRCSRRFRRARTSRRLTRYSSRPSTTLFWDRDRDEMLWDFFYRIEVYTPKAKRVYGYYVMPILHGCELIGRIDPKVERKQKRAHIQQLAPGARRQATWRVVPRLDPRH